MRLFYSPDISTGILPEEEAIHAIRVLRLKVNDEIELIDGNGLSAHASISFINKKKCEFIVKETFQTEDSLGHLHLAIAPTKSTDRLEWMIEKLTEIGIGSIHLIITKRTERSKINVERLIKKIISAAKQSQKSFFPKIFTYNSLDNFLVNQSFDQSFIAHLEEDNRIYLSKAMKTSLSTCVLIGPEGDFTLEEIESAKKNGFKAVTLGDFRLRTETAAVFTAAAMNNSRYLV